jgi:uncharacterized protein (UPF0335 family)
MSNQTQENNPQLTEQQVFDKLVTVFNEIWSLEQDIKEILDDAKENGLEELTLLKSIAKAKAWNKVGDLEAKAQAQLAKIEQYA